MARNTRIRNVGRESINLYPFQILLERNEEVVAEITPSEFLTQFGGTNNSVLSNLSISPTGDAPTVSKASGGGGGISVTMDASTGTSGVPVTWPVERTVFGSTAGAPRYIELPAPAAADAASQYVVKDAANNAATHNITVTASGGANIDAGTSAVISSNGGSLSFVTDGSKWLVI